MKLLKKGFMLVVAVAMLFNSCTVEKRLYSSGYYIDWNHNNEKSDNVRRKDIVVVNKNSFTSKVSANDKEFINKKSAISEVAIGSSFISDVDKSFVGFSNGSNSFINPKDLKCKIEKDSCDLIILKNGQEVLAKVFEVTISEVKYKECSNLDGPVFTKRKSDFFMIKYSNGTNTVFNNEEVATTSTTNSTGAGDRGSQTVAFVLCLLIGVFGIHRFYLGHIGMGILYLLTAGLCGIGWLVDIIMICTGDLKPRNGDYLEKW